MNVEATAARTRHTITVTDGTEIFFKDWVAGQPIVFSHRSPLNSDAWEDQMVVLADPGYLTRGEGCSDWRRDATDAEDGPKPRWPADRSLQRYARRRDGGSVAVHQGLKRAVLRGQSTQRDGVASSLGCVLAPRHAGRNPGHPRVHQSVLRERSYRRSEEGRCADADPARRRRSDRTDRRLRAGLGDPREGFDLNGLSGFLHRHVHGQQGSDQHGSISLSSVCVNGAG